ncbi:MAG TPA: fumarylacetoacetate hydrolase family protein [Thermodesulfobacteriota bacterium]|nr:fumarylacetoacetate hydrolase family protein [Thermodesulfobacteriota bacterium]
MRFLRFKSEEGKTGFGLLEGKSVIEVEGNIFGEYRIAKAEHRLDKIKLLPPCLPTKIVAVGLNYKDHAEEMKKDPPEEPMLFMKPSTSVIGHEDKIIYPKHMSSRVDYEGELAVVIGRKASWVKEREAYQYVFGYTCINDVTARDLQAKDVQYTRAKGFDTFAPIGPVIETEVDPANLKITTILNGEIRQHSSTSNLIFSVPRLLSFISHVMTLLPGDIIATGTPAGIGPMKSGDKVEVEIEGIGVLRNYVE